MKLKLTLLGLALALTTPAHSTSNFKLPLYILLSVYPGWLVGNSAYNSVERTPLDQYRRNLQQKSANSLRDAGRQLRESTYTNDPEKQRLAQRDAANSMERSGTCQLYGAAPDAVLEEYKHNDAISSGILGGTVTTGLLTFLLAAIFGAE